MRLNTLINDDTHADQLNEAKPAKKSKDPITRPHGISIEEFTPAYIAELESVRDNDPDLWHKIKNGL